MMRPEHRRVADRHLARRRCRVRQRLAHRAPMHLVPIRQRADRQPFIPVVLADTFEHLHTLELASTYAPRDRLGRRHERRDRQVGGGARSSPHHYGPKWGHIRLSLSVWAMCRYDGYQASQATVLRLLRDEGLLLEANYQRERRQNAARRKAAFATDPTGPNQVWQLDFSEFETARGGTWRLAGCQDYGSKYEHPWHTSPTANQHDVGSPRSSSPWPTTRPPLATPGSPPARSTRTATWCRRRRS